MRKGLQCQYQSDALRKTYHAKNLHTKQQRITENVSRVRQPILLPHLTKEIHPARHTVMIIHEIAFKKAVNRTTCSMSVMLKSPSCQRKATRLLGISYSIAKPAESDNKMHSQMTNHITTKRSE